MSKFCWNEIPYPGEKYAPIGEGEDALKNLTNKQKKLALYWNSLSNRC